MVAMQLMCGRVAVVTKRGLTGTLRQHYHKAVVWMVLLFSFPAIILNIGADIAGMGAVANLVFPKVPANLFSVVFTGILLVVMVYLPYKKIAEVLKYLCVTLLVYLVVPFLIKTDWGEVFRGTFIPKIQFNKDYISMLVAILGTTISPYLFFWQANMEVEEIEEKKEQNIMVIDKRELSDMKQDIDFGMFFSNLVMFFIILTTGMVLFKGGIHKIDTVEQAAQALKPLAGNAAYLLFAIGVVGTGLLAVPVLCGSISYMFSETFGWKEGLNKKLGEARSFYAIMALSLVMGLALNYVGISPVQALIYAAILYGVTAPVLIAVVLHICNNKKIMGEYTNSKLANFAGIATFVFMAASAVTLIYLQVTG
jgi:Mn2+/Fe2+ NRAMP family transporter